MNKNLRATLIDFIAKFVNPLALLVPVFVLSFIGSTGASPYCRSSVGGTIVYDPISKDTKLNEIWSKLINENKYDETTLIAYPAPKRMLYLTFKLSLRLKEHLENLGYTCELVRLGVRTDLKNYVPARWAIKITKAPKSSWFGRVVQNSMQNMESEFFFDPYGLYRNSSDGGTDYVGQTRITLGMDYIQKLDFDYIDSLLHEIHHASNHKKLKEQNPSGIYAEVNSLFKPNSKTQHRFSKQYPFYFHFDELAAYAKEIAQIKRNLARARPGEKNYNELLKKFNFYKDLYKELHSEAVIVLDLALKTFLTEKGRKETVFFLDGFHKNATAQIYLKKSEEVENDFKFTVWTPGISRLDHNAKSYRAVYLEIVSLKNKIHLLRPDEVILE